MSHVLHSNPLRLGPVSGPACVFKRKAMPVDRKVFILHDNGENSTVARLRTGSLAKALDSSGVVAYYRNAVHEHSALKDPNESLRYSWSGCGHKDLVESAKHINDTVRRKGAYVAMIGLGQSRQVLELIAKEHNLKESTPSPSKLPNSGSYPITLLTPSLFTTFYVAESEPPSDNTVFPLPFKTLPNEALLTKFKEIIASGQQLYDIQQPSLNELKAANALKKHQLLDTMQHKEQEKEAWNRLKKRYDTGEGLVLPDLPLSGRQRRRHEKLEAQKAKTGKEEKNLNVEVPEARLDGVPPVVQELEGIVEDTDKVSNVVIAPTAEPVVPCSVELLNEMIQWLELNVDIAPEQEPRIDFVRGSILGRTTRGSGKSVDLCKMVVGPKGIGPILEAVGKNSHIDRFLLGNNIVGDIGAKIIADFMMSEKSRRVYNFYVRIKNLPSQLVPDLQQLAGNDIGPEGIYHIANALTTNTTVTALWLKRNPLTPQGAKHLASMLSVNTTLETLDLVNTGIRDEGVVAIMEALQSNPASALKHLYLGTNAETVVSARAIGKYLRSGRSRLTTLFVGSSRLGDEGVIEIAEGLKTDMLIERLGLESVRCGDVGAKALADALKNHPAMIVLDLGFRKGTNELGEKANCITDDGLFYLGEQLFGSQDTAKRNTIRGFSVVNNKITKDGALNFMDKYVDPNEHLLDVRLSQVNANGNKKVKHITGALNDKRRKKYFDSEQDLSIEENAERNRVKEAFNPRHIAEIYSIYRVNM